MTINETKLVNLAKLYYSGKDTETSDQEYDNLLDSVKLDNPEFDLFEHLELDSGAKKEHPDTFEQPEFKYKVGDIQETEYRDGDIICPKYDGSSVRAYYRNGNLYLILSRSNEHIGHVQTEKMRSKVPSKVSSEITSIDFEACCSFEDIGDKCRQKANGLVNSKYKDDEVNEFLTLVPFNSVCTDPSIGFYERMNMCGFVNGVDYSAWSVGSKILSNDPKFVLNGKTFPIDGYVLYNPKTGFRIWKYYYTEVKESTVLGIEWNESPSFNYVPKLQIEPVNITGSWISRVATNGANNLFNNKMGVGAKVSVVLSGSTIPQAIKTIEPSEDWGDLSCPHCKKNENLHSPLERIGDGYRCVNIKCSLVIWALTDRTLRMFFPSEIVDELRKDYPFELERTLDNLGEILKPYQDHFISGSDNKGVLKSIISASKIPRLNNWRLDECVDSLFLNMNEEKPNLVGLTGNQKAVLDQLLPNILSLYRTFVQYNTEIVS